MSRELGIEDVQWFPLPFEELIPAVLGGRIDVVASGLFVTPERTRQVRFSRPTACVQPALVLKGEDRRRDRASGAADCPDCRIAVIKGGVEEAVLERYEPSKWEAKSVPDLATAVAAVEDGSADALAISAPTARTIVRAHPALVLDRRTLPEAVAQEAQGCAALAFRPADGELVEAFDSVLETFVGSPGHLQIVVPFGFTRAELPCAGSPAASSAGSTGECSAGGAPK